MYLHAPHPHPCTHTHAFVSVSCVCPHHVSRQRACLNILVIVDTDERLFFYSRAYHMPDICTSIAMFASPPICHGYSVPVTLPLTPNLFMSSVNTVSPYSHTSHTLALLLCVALLPSSLPFPPTPRPVPSHQPRGPLARPASPLITIPSPSRLPLISTS